MIERLLLLSDDEILHSTFKSESALLGIDLEAAATWEEAAIRLRRRNLSCLVIDIEISMQRSLQVIRTIRLLDQGLSILVLVDPDAALNGVSAVEAGATRALVKPTSLGKLRQYFASEVPEPTRSSGIVAFCGLVFERKAYRATINGTQMPLSPREASLLELLVLYHDRPVSKQQIQDAWMLAPSGWGDDRGRGNSVQIYVHRLRSKLAGSQFTIRTLRARGYILETSSVWPHQIVPVR